ncbi:MarR family transcriptional regulator [Mesorhizobium sp. CU2]|uniref:MarR family winged helix-turn-helix transcriptional regulator n=1 Tax=unclassified Mesorhizobium TaxID=325217 RepID=UPI00112630AC|nr:MULTISPECIES: MarR family transcriptional regulator [unclassified Mesorhizobium]TPN85616.1 MarR family transcriptional regulator [Mesorhizobium sp. CU3]TPO10294.1 MarR family transcriptional regulator [Mesorhizobium sp. CU2]
MNKSKHGWVKAPSPYGRDARGEREREAGSREQVHRAGWSLEDDAAAPDIRDLFSFELQRLAGLSTRIATLSIRPKYGLTAREWRALAVLRYLGTVPLQELAKHSGLLKSQMSRTVSGLIDRGYIQKAANPEDGRSILLRLSPEGLDLSERVLDDSFERNEHMLATLSYAERQILVELMRRVIRTSSTYFHDLKQQATQSDLDQLDEE